MTKHVRAFAAWAFALILFALVGAAPAVAQEAAQPLLHTMFQDHAVLQRDQPLRIWGHAPPRAQVVVTLAGQRRVVRAARDGAWSATLQPIAAGGPYDLEVRTHGAEQIVRDVLIGDVWLCSGQSNMAWSVGSSLYSQFEIANSANANIRHFYIAERSALAPLAAFPTTPSGWEVAGPDTVADWTAACYFFARELRRNVDVPMGLVNASWGGSNIRAWISSPSLRRIGSWNDQLDLLDLKARDEPAAIAQWGSLWQRWWREAMPTQGEPWSPAAGAAWTTAAPSNDWVAAERSRFVGLLWHRATVTLTAEQAAQGRTVALGVIDEADQAWVNGTFVGATGDWSTDRNYAIPAGVLHAGENVVVVSSLNTSGQGGLRGPPSNLGVVLADGERVVFGDWRFWESPQGPQPPRAPWGSITGFSTLYNAMIAPIGPYNFRGAVWYQGESNTGEPESYQALMSGLFADWRGRFQSPDLPFLVVQLPNFGAIPRAPTESGWSGVREAQRRAVVADAHAGLAVTIDVGEAWELHPPNKQDIGRRLARAARHVVYGEDISPSGAAVQGARREGDDIVVSFAGVQDSLAAFSGAPNAFELCGPAAGSCTYVTARIDGTNVRLPTNASATRVRYCWGDAPICTLSDGSGLPAGPFEVEIR